MNLRRIALVAPFLALATGSALAQTPAFVGSGIDPNTFIVGHPASPRWITAHANHEHPAVVRARLAQRGTAIDPNTFAVQPPASVRWLASAEEPAALTLARR